VAWRLHNEINFKTFRATSYTAFQTVRHRFNIYASSCVALALCRRDEQRKLVIRFVVI